VCQEVAPIYEETALKLDVSKDIEFARVDCKDEAELCTRFSTPIYPTIRLFRGLELQELYNGARVPFE
jgi:protein disulfide-isomerase A1